MSLTTQQSQPFASGEKTSSPPSPTLTTIDLPPSSPSHQLTTSPHHHVQFDQAIEIAEFHRATDRRIQQLELQVKKSQEILVSMSSKIEMILYAISNSPSSYKPIHQFIRSNIHHKGLKVSNFRLKILA